MATKNPRVQVTVDPELSEAMAAVDPQPRSRSRLIRDLALRGAEATLEERRKHDEAIEVLLKVARGDIDYDFDALSEVIEENEAVPLPCKQPPE